VNAARRIGEERIVLFILKAATTEMKDRQQAAKLQATGVKQPLAIERAASW